MRNDPQMISKLSAYKDLFAYDAKYHKTCYSHYISSRNIKSEQNKTNLNSPLQTAELMECTSDSDDVVENRSFERDNDSIKHTEIRIIHQAAGILRKHMSEFQTSRKNLPSPNDINISQFKNQVPKILLTFTSWLIDEEKYNRVNEDVKSEAVVPSNIIMGLFDKNFKQNHFQIGLGLHIYHLVRSKQILEILFQLGLTCSYKDVRGLMTSLAKRSLDGNNEIYIPPGIRPVDEKENNYIRASIDNFDLNEETANVLHMLWQSYCFRSAQKSLYVIMTLKKLTNIPLVLMTQTSLSKIY